MIWSRSLLLVVLPLVVSAGAVEPDDVLPRGRQLLLEIGARIENSATAKELESYRALFTKLDANGDSFLSTKEFVEDGNYLTREARQGIFRASDSDHSDLVTADEYVVNRVITEEAKAFFNKLDQDQSGELTESEVVASGVIADQKLAVEFFAGLDSNEDGKLLTPEFLRTWGQWARQAPITAWLIAEQVDYLLPADWQSEEFRKRIIEQQDSDKLPSVPTVKLILQLRNVGTEPVAIWPGGGIDEPVLTIKGPGIVQPENLQSFFGSSSSATTPQPVIMPGHKYEISIESLNPGGFSLDNVYWTQPGEYTITATYPVWKNLPPHLPQLFKNQPEPQGPPIQFQVQSTACVVKVSLDSP